MTNARILPLRLLLATGLVALASVWFIGWIDEGPHRPSTYVFASLLFPVLVPSFAALLVSPTRPLSVDWLIVAVVASLPMAFLFARETHGDLSYDNGRETVVSATISTFVSNTLLSLGFSLGAFVLAGRKRILSPDGLERPAP